MEMAPLVEESGRKGGKTEREPAGTRGRHAPSSRGGQDAGLGEARPAGAERCGSAEPGRPLLPEAPAPPQPRLLLPAPPRASRSQRGKVRRRCCSQPERNTLDSLKPLMLTTEEGE